MVENCVDIRQLPMAKRWRWQYDGSFAWEKNPEVRGDGRWYVEVICKYGLIYPYGDGDLLALSTAKGMSKRLLDLDPAVRIHQNGSGEGVVRFPAGLLAAVAALLKPRYKRLLDPERARIISEGNPRDAHGRLRSPGTTQDDPDGSEG